MAKDVVLLKSEADGPDRYIKAFVDHGFSVGYIRSHQFRWYVRDLRHVQCDSFDGIIFTSRQAVCVYAAHHERCTDDECNSKKKCFVVGKTTDRAARLLGFWPQGASSGCAANLASYIVKTLSSEDTLSPEDTSPEALSPEDTNLAPSRADQKTTLLYPCSVLTDPLPPAIVDSENIAVQKISCYTSEAHATLSEELRSALQSKLPPRVLVFFSPSSAKFATSTLNDLPPRCSLPKLVSLGQSTSEALREAGFHVSGQADEPTPEAVRAAVAQCIAEDANHPNRPTGPNAAITRAVSKATCPPIC